MTILCFVLSRQSENRKEVCGVNDGEHIRDEEDDADVLQ